MSILLLASILISVIVGAVIGWAFCYLRFAGSDKAVGEIKHQSLAKDREIQELRARLDVLQREKAVAETRAEEANKRIEEQKVLLEKAQERMTTTFQALSGESLKSNNRAFLELAKESLDAVLQEARGDMGKKEESIKTLVKPLEEALKRYEHQIGEMEKTRAEAYGGLGKQISALLEAQQSLQKETGNLITALRRPEVRGRWGEVTLKRVAELAGLTAHCDYTEQVSVNTEDGRIRPDMIVHLPAGREIVVDSKVSLDAYLDAVSADTVERKKELMTKHAQQVRKHMRDLAAKSYWSQFQEAPEFVVMFIPGEAFMSAAVENDPALIEDGMGAKVIIATPTTLIALLRAIAYGWKQERLARNAQEIADIGKELYDRFQPFLEHINKTGSFLSQAVVAFNRMVMSLERRVMVSVKKFRELGASTDKELDEIKHIEQIPMAAQDSEAQEEQVKVEREHTK